MKSKFLLLLIPAVLGVTATSCGSSDEYTITIAASESPHKLILENAVKDILKEDGYSLKVTVLDWTVQNDAVAHGEYDANYFQHIPYLDSYNETAAADAQISPICKVHYEKLCLYASDVNHKTLENGDKIEIVNDVTNIERALLLLQDNNILTINSSCYDSEGNFTNFDTTNPNKEVTFATNYANCSLTCIQESKLGVSLSDYDFGIIPGNTALTAFGNNLTEKIALSENPTDETVSLRSNVIAVKKGNENTAKSKELVKALADERVKDYIENTFGASVLYHYENLLNK